MGSHHVRRSVGRAPLPRRSTKGPLDDMNDDPLSDSVASQASPSLSVTSPSTHSNETDLGEKAPLATLINSDLPVVDKDLSFLLDTTIYHPLGQIDVPQVFRKPFPPPPAPGSTLDDLFHRLDILLSQCHFLGAAHLAGLVLTSGNVASTDYSTIFRLLSIRYSSLELSGNTLLAAQEAKALEDLSSTFYYHDATLLEATADMPEHQRRLPAHIMPFDLRLQAIRLQAIGFSDVRRGISALYDLGLECRENLALATARDYDAFTWASRLEEIGLRVVNTLIEMSDIDCARRALASMKPTNSSKIGLWTAKMILLLIKIGDISHARKILEETHLREPERALIQSLLLVADGRYADTVVYLSGQLDCDIDPDIQILVRQNLAVAYLYTGHINKCAEMLEELVSENHGHQLLVSNLATLYELRSDQARDLKVALAERVANGTDQRPRPSFLNADFRLQQSSAQRA